MHSLTATVAVADRDPRSNARMKNTRLDISAGKVTAERTSPVTGSTVNSREPASEYTTIFDALKAVTRPTIWLGLVQLVKRNL